MCKIKNLQSNPLVSSPVVLLPFLLRVGAVSLEEGAGERTETEGSGGVGYNKKSIDNHQIINAFSQSG